MNSKRQAFVLFLTVFVDMMGFSVIFPIFPQTLRFFWEKGNDPILSIFQAYVLSILPSSENPYFIVLFGGITSSVYAILQFFFAPFWGKISDHLGRKPILLFTSLGNFLGYLVWFFADSFTLFVLSRVITGCMGGNISVASAAMADVTSEQDRTKGMGFIGAGIGLGFLFGPPLGGLLSGYNLLNHFPNLANWKVTIFSSSALLSVFVALINLVVVFLFFDETLTQKIKSKIQHPILNLKDSTIQELPLLCAIYFFFTLGFSGFEFGINFFFDQVLHFSPREIGYSFVYMGSIVIFVQGGVIRKISGKIPEKKIALLGVFTLLFGFSLLSFSKSTILTMLCLSFLSVGSALLNPSISALTSLFSPQSEQGKNLGILRGFGSLARAFSPTLFSLVYFQFGSNSSFVLALLIFIIVLSLLLKIPETKNVF